MPTLLGALGHVISGAGRTYDYLTPGAGTSTLTSLGREQYGRYNDTNNSGYNLNTTIGNLTGGGTNIAPAVPTANASNASGTYATAPLATGGTSAAQSAANTQALTVANSALDRLPSQLAIAQGNVNTQYGQQLGALDSDKAQNQSSYDTSSTQNQQDRVGNLNTIDSQASSGLRGLLRILGQHGAGGSSAAQYAAPDAVGNLATQQRAGAGQTFGQNQQSLDTNWNNYLGGYDNSRKQLDDWKTQQLNTAQSTSDSNKQSLLQTLAGLQTSPAAAQPYIDQINSLSGAIDNLGRLNPTYTGNTPVYTAPDISSYNVGEAATPELQGGGATPGASTPWLQMLLGQQKKQQTTF